MSTGYYNPKAKAVFCYWDEATIELVLRHEVTHQLFSEACYFEPVLPEEMPSDFWIVEGVALYMESMTVSPYAGCDVASIGGWDSPRLQPARYRRLHDETWIEWPQFRLATSESFRSGADIKLFYAQAAGLAHRWLDGDTKERRQFIDYVLQVYQGGSQAASLLQIDSDASLRSSYDQFLLTPSLKWPDFRQKAFASLRRDVVLTQVPVTSEQLLEWPQEYRSLDWLDLSFTNIDDQLFSDAQNGSWSTRRLNVEKTKVSDRSMTFIAAIRKLEDLDLSNCPVTDEGLVALKDHPNLRYLWLTGTAITDDSVPILLSIPKLESLEITGTQISETGKQNLLAKNPRLKKEKMIMGNELTRTLGSQVMALIRFNAEKRIPQCSTLGRSV